ncbi:uncharacterized protein LOC134829190 [Culicoides brevitarsis]|uniref:uncharacterized protein LOC134829190 n=1 Tax=Culicoides brevitarsis TaxID=469753 RepID=UPI00307B7055
MAILHSCCFWRSVRKGSFASVIYTMTYFSISCITLTTFVLENEAYISGEVAKPQGESFLDQEMTPTTFVFNVLLLTCAAFGILSSILAIIGLRKDKRVLLIPWIFVMIADIGVELSHFVYLVAYSKIEFVPLTATLFTVDFFIMCLNVYSLLCVISQYQEYKAGRGGAPHNILSCTDNVHYIAPSTTCLNNIRQSRNMLSPIICPHTHCSLIPEEPLNGSLNSAHSKKNNDKVPPYQQQQQQQRQARLFVLKKSKHVNFPDDESKKTNLISVEPKVMMYKCATNQTSNGNKVIMIDTLPEYSEDIISWQEQNQ